MQLPIITRQTRAGPIPYSMGMESGVGRAQPWRVGSQTPLPTAGGVDVSGEHLSLLDGGGIRLLHSKNNTIPDTIQQATPLLPAGGGMSQLGVSLGQVGGRPNNSP